jgi:hypothetical protein
MIPEALSFAQIPEVVRSMGNSGRLGGFMPRANRRSLHPLLLERGYWRNRLQELKLTRSSVLLIPRPELSTPAIEVDEFRIRAHDGIRLYGLRAQNRLNVSGKSARIRMVGPCDLPEIDRELVADGATEFVFQEPAGRRLEDRVLDVLRVCQLASADSHIDANRVRLFVPDPEQEPDEFLIASQLLADDISK